MNDHIFRHMLDATAPLIVWALYFFAAYIFVALACDSILVQAQWLGQSLIRSVLMLWTIATGLALALLLWRAIINYRGAAYALMSAARLACALLALIASAWAAAPMFILSVCSQ